MENKMRTLDLFTATAANANLFNEGNKAQKAHTRSTLGSTIKNAVQKALRYIEINHGGKALEISADEKGIDPKRCAVGGVISEFRDITLFEI